MKKMKAVARTLKHREGGIMVPDRLNSTCLGRLNGQPWGMICFCLALLFVAGTTREACALVTKAELKAADEAIEQTVDQTKDAEKLLKKQNKVLKKAEKAVTELEEDLADLNEDFAKAAKDKKAHLAQEIRETQEELRKAVTARSQAERDVATTKQRIDTLAKEKDKAEKALANLKEREKTELAEWKEQQKKAAEEAAAANTATAAPTAESKELAAKVDDAKQKKDQGQAVVKARQKDVAAAKDQEAKKKAEKALNDAKQYKSDKDREYEKAKNQLQQAEEQPALTPKKHKRETLVSEPAPWVEKAPQQPPTLRGDAGGIVTPPEQKADIAAPGTKLQFDVPMISGDKEVVQELDVWKEWADYVTFNAVTADEINEFHGRLTKALQQEGYVFATVTFPTRIWAYGIFLAKVDLGPLGTITVKGNRHYSAKQIIRSLANQEADTFNYARIHGDLFDLNAKPDISVDTKLKPVMQDGRRVINAEIEVEDDLPIHGAIELSNTGTEHTNDWRIRTTLQHLNLTKHDDILTFDWITSPDVSDVNAFSGAYFLPVNDEWTLNVYSGYSDSDIDDVLPQLDVRGKGYYLGAQATKTLTETATYRTQLSLAWLYQNWQSVNVIGGEEFDDQEDELHLSMPSVILGYASRVFDSLHGRNFASVTAQANFAGNFGSSDKAEFIKNGSLADGDFLLGKFQIARLQRFFSGEDAPGKWTVFMKLDAQVASDTLPPPVRQSVGGANSVRGYEEQEVAADNTVVATVELRTPLFRNFIPGLKKSDDYLEMNPDAWQQHRLQFIAFADYGYVDNKEPLPGEMTNESLLSAGVGLRLGLTKYSQMRLDYGYPLMDTTADTPSSGRIHLSMQVQF
jgi:hemolysin activation/secretion protein